MEVARLKEASADCGTLRTTRLTGLDIEVRHPPSTPAQEQITLLEPLLVSYQAISKLLSFLDILVV